MSPLFGGSRSILDRTTEFFTQEGWRFEPIEGKPIIRMGFKGDNGSWMCFAQAKEDSHQLLFYSIMESNVAEKKRHEIAEFITRANYGLQIGNFEMDFSDGEIRYKTSIDVEGGELTLKMIRTMVYVNILMMDRYLPGIMSVLHAGTSPAAAIEQVEK